MRPTKERIEEIRNYLDRQNKLSNFYRDTNTDLLADLLAEINGLEEDKDQLIKNYQALHHEFAVMSGHSSCGKSFYFPGEK